MKRHRMAQGRWREESVAEWGEEARATIAKVLEKPEESTATACCMDVADARKRGWVPA